MEKSENQGVSQKKQLQEDSLQFDPEYVTQNFYLLKIIVQSYFEGKKQFKSQEFLGQIFKLLHNDSNSQQTIQDYLNGIKDSYKIKESCGKTILRGQLSFQCLDCGIDKDSHLICNDCFSTQIHKNHKITYSTDHIGTCDCGDYQAILNQGCCLKHKGNPNQFSQKENIWKKTIPQDFKIALEQLFFLLLSIILEKGQDASLNKQSQNRQQIMFQNIFNSITQVILEFIYFFIENTPVLVSFIGNLFIQQIMGIDQKLAKILTHHCHNLDKVITKSNPDSEMCTCTYLENIFRISCKMDDSCNDIFNKIFSLIYKNDVNFMNKLIQTYTKMFKFLIYQTKQPAGVYTTNLFNLYAQFFTKSASEIWLKDQQFYLNHIHEKVRDIVELYFSPISRHAYNCFNQIKQIYIFWLKKDQLACNLNYKKMIKVLSECVFLTQKKKTQHQEDEIEKCRLHIECSFLLIIKELVYKIYNQNSEKQLFLLEYFLTCLLKEALNIDYSTQFDLDEDEDNYKQWPIHYTGLRSMSIIMNVLVMQAGPLYLKQFLEQKLEGKQQQKLIKNMITCSLKALRFARLTEQKVGNFYEMLMDPHKSMKIEIINSFYKKSYYGQYDLDISLIQTLFSFSLQSEKNQQVSIMNTISQIYGNIDIKKIYFMADNKIYRENLAKVLELIVVLIVDSTSFINSIACTKVLQAKNDDKRPYWVLKHLENVVINAFHIHKSKDMRTVKEVLFDKILNYDIHLEDFINNVAIYNQNTNHLRLKPEYEKKYEPYMFHKYTRLNQDLFEKIVSITQQDKNLDPIMSTMDLYEEQSFQRQIMDILFSDEIPRYIMLCFRIDGLNQSQNDVLKHSVKLVTVYLQFCYKEIQLDEFDENRVVFDNLLKYCLKPEWENKVEEMKNNQNLKEMKQTFINIQNLIKVLKQDLLKKSNEETTNKLRKSMKKQQDNYPSAAESPLRNKEKLMKMKKEQIRKNFLEKQQKFMKKNNDLVQNLPELQGNQQLLNNSENQNEVCNICHDLLSKNAKYGIYAHISQDNLIQFCTTYPDHQNSGFNVQSCNHFLHKTCNDDMFENNLKEIDKQKHLFTYKYEVLCGHCKFLSNIFVQFMDESKCIYYKDFCKNIQQKQSQEKNNQNGKQVSQYDKKYNSDSKNRSSFLDENQNNLSSCYSISDEVPNTVDKINSTINPKLNQQCEKNNSIVFKNNNKKDDKNINDNKNNNIFISQNINIENNKNINNKSNNYDSLQNDKILEPSSQIQKINQLQHKNHFQMLKHAKSDIISEEQIYFNEQSKQNQQIFEDKKSIENNNRNRQIRKMTYSFHNEDLHIQKASKINYKCMNEDDIQSMHENLSLSFEQQLQTLTYKDIIIFVNKLDFILDNTFDIGLIEEELFGQILMVFRSQINPQKEKAINEKSWILYCCFKMLFYVSHNISLGGLTLYFKKSIYLYRNIYLNFREYFFYYLHYIDDEQFKTLYIQNLKSKFLMDLQVFFNKKMFINSIDSLRSKEEMYFQLIWQCSVLCKDDETFLVQTFLLLTQNFFRMMIAVHYVAYSEKQKPNIDQKKKSFTIHMPSNPNKVYDSQDFNKQLQNEEFKYELVNFLLPFCRKVIGIFFTVFKSSQKDINNLDMDQYGSDFNEFDSYISIMDQIDPKFKTFHLIIDKQLINNMQDKICDLVKAKSLYKSGYQNFTIVILPVNYLEFQKQYNVFRCDICNYFPRATDPYLCLICEKVLCSVKCHMNEPKIDTNMKKKSKKRGNLNQHSIDVHKGKCAFLHLQRGLVVLMSYPKMVSYGHMYQDIYGQLPNVKNMNWEDYQINFKLHNRIQELIISQRIPQEITYKLMKDDLCLFQKDYV